MWYVQGALLSEGPTDDRFIPSLLTRAVDEVCRTEFEAPVEMADVVPLRSRGGPAPVAEMVALCEENAASFNLFFLHHDAGARDLARVTREWLVPFRESWVSSGLGVPHVEVVPIRETEAWGLASGDGLRRALGVTFTDDELGVPPRPRDVESIPDPKAVIDAAVRKLSGPPVDVYARLGDTVDLDALQTVPSFQNMLAQVRASLLSLGMKALNS